MSDFARYGLAAVTVAGILAYAGIGVWAAGYPAAGVALLGLAAAVILGIVAVAEVVRL